MGDPTDTTQYLYVVQVGPSGTINFLRVWPDFTLEYRGIDAGDQQRSYPYRIAVSWASRSCGCLAQSGGSPP